MNRQFWHERWRRNEIGFHRDSVHPALECHWSAVAGDSRPPVLVPLCGKSLDLHWLARRGHDVVGVEVDGSAIEAFFEEAGLVPDYSTRSAAMPMWQSGRISILEGDFFEFTPDTPFELVYDRAALIALPRTMRQAYLDHLAGMLTPLANGLLITLEYDQHEMDGPPFAVLPDELDASDSFDFELVERRDVPGSRPGFGEHGLKWLSESSYRFSRR